MIKNPDSNPPPLVTTPAPEQQPEAMDWWQLSIHSSADRLETTENCLLQLGALSISISDAQDEPLYEPLPGETPLWSESIITGLFDQSENIETLFDRLCQQLPADQISSIKQERLPGQIWERAHLDRFQPQKFGPNLWVVPSWTEAPEPDAVNIQLDPGIAFGTGSHPTTALCLAWLAHHAPQKQQVIDYGCGSGILAIAAHKLGANSLQCVDIDPQALEATAENARRNQIDPETLHICQPSALKAAAVDLLMANILSAPLIELAPTFASLIKTHGSVLLSGILAEQSDQVLQAYQPFFKMQSAVFEDGWCRLSGTRLG